MLTFPHREFQTIWRGKLSLRSVFEENGSTCFRILVTSETDALVVSWKVAKSYMSFHALRTHDQLMDGTYITHMVYVHSKVT